MSEDWVLFSVFCGLVAAGAAVTLLAIVLGVAATMPPIG